MQDENFEKARGWSFISGKIRTPFLHNVTPPKFCLVWIALALRKTQRTFFKDFHERPNVLYRLELQ